jgi:hydrogenase expression/formation protein HypE
MSSPASGKKRHGKLLSQVITLAHGGGGKAMRDLIDDVFIEAFDNEALNTLEDQARFSLSDLQRHGG